MAAILFRLILIALGLGLIETGLIGALAAGSVAGWVTILIGMILLVAGSAGWMGALLGGSPKGRRP